MSFNPHTARRERRLRSILPARLSLHSSSQRGYPPPTSLSHLSLTHYGRKLQRREHDRACPTSKRREASMHTLRRCYVNISRAVGRLNTRMAGRHEWLLALPGHCARQVGGRAGSQRVYESLEQLSRGHAHCLGANARWPAATRGATSSLDDTFKCT